MGKANFGNVKDTGWFSAKTGREYHWNYVSKLITNAMVGNMGKKGDMGKILGDIILEIFKQDLKEQNFDFTSLASGTILRKLNQGRDYPTAPWIDSGEFLDDLKVDVVAGGGKMSVQMGIDYGAEHEGSSEGSGISYGRLTTVLENGWTIHITNPESISKVIAWLKNNLPGVYGPDSSQDNTVHKNGNSLEVQGNGGKGSEMGGGIVIDIPPRPLMPPNRERMYAEFFTSVILEAWYAKIGVVKDELGKDPKRRWYKAASKAWRVEREQIRKHKP